MNDRALARCVGDVAAFALQHWGRRPLLLRGRGPFDDLLDLDAVETLLASLARRPTFRVVRDGATVAPSQYTRTARVGGTDVPDVADVERIVDLVAEGATVVLQSLQRTWPPLQHFCAALEVETSHPVQANAYLSPGGGTAGLGRHRDAHDVVVLQLAGTKGWDVDGLGANTLAAGDVLYLPAGTKHAACAEAGFSLHLTVGLLAVTRRQLLRRVLDGLDTSFDQPLPLGFAAAEAQADLQATVAATLQEAARALADVDLTATAASEVARAVDRRRRSSPGRLAAVLDPTALDDDGAVLERAVPVDVERSPAGEVIVVFAGRRLRMPAVTAGAIDAVVAKRRLAVSELAGLDAPARLVLARRLVREGLLDIAAPTA